VLLELLRDESDARDDNLECGAVVGADEVDVAHNVEADLLDGGALAPAAGGHVPDGGRRNHKVGTEELLVDAPEGKEVKEVRKGMDRNERAMMKK